MLEPLRMSLDTERLRGLLCALQDAVQSAVLAARDSRSAADLAAVAEETPSDTLYGIDGPGEAAAVDWLDAHWPEDLPVEVVMEGREARTFPRGLPDASEARLVCIVDPIDGTRGFMHDKRSAWVLSAVAPRRQGGARLGDLAVAAMTELPPAKQRLADQLSAVRGAGQGGLRARRRDLNSRSETAFAPRPSAAPDLAHGFAAFAHFFPRGKGLLARFEETLWERLHGDAPVFDDQYLSTGGQLYELLTGRDRLLGDLRPLAREALGSDAVPVCHPYDACTALIAEAAGCIVQDARGGPLDAPLDTTSAVAWVGFANAALERRVRPVLDEVLREFFPVPG